MKTKVSCSCGSENCLECAIVELQGTSELNLHFKPTFKTSELANSSEFHPLPTQAYYDSNNKGDLPSSKVELYVIGIIRHKIFFKPRPKALISTAQRLLLHFLSLLDSVMFITVKFVSTEAQMVLIRGEFV
ncbi:hypothetical protein SADUNF_Sadunf12G0108300 [Salix dunnii]|uniref:Post-SET domain-containing protein n=1 Tax=Salix dunnii TaxID=1413687 RepID=A0A835JM86_9ROSI|nr:hypothetical protein SADUNF_Sadunf12G0108300 [Salix dunnii]